MARLRVGIQLPEVEREVRWPEYVAMARAAEAVGFDSIWIGDHYLYRGDGRPERGPWEAWTMLAALAAVTERVRLGPLVACLAFHEPAVLAKMAASIDEISGGRLVLGVGAGWNEAEFRAFGIPYDHRVARFEESYEIVRRLLDGERVTFHGTYAHVDDAVLLPRPERRPTLMIGSSGKRMLAIASPTADAWNTWFDEYGNTLDGYALLRDRIDDACVAAGREPGDVERSVCVLVAVDGGAGARAIPPGMHAIDGSPSALGDHLRGLSDLGVGEVILVADPIDERAVRALGEAVGSVRA
ncbi:MAG TPA: LLM class flavin-dependent oxidoreductase [Actinomycetota bacterium]|jgi:probable F420-dependent oxidoreductase|nr:LLM class flavin-dependent oxidoreductase [Actinomycetota bacterium]